MSFIFFFLTRLHPKNLDADLFHQNTGQRQNRWCLRRQEVTKDRKERFLRKVYGKFNILSQKDLMSVTEKCYRRNERLSNVKFILLTRQTKKRVWLEVKIPPPSQIMMFFHIAWLFFFATRPLWSAKPPLFPVEVRLLKKQFMKWNELILSVKGEKFFIFLSCLFFYKWWMMVAWSGVILILSSSKLLKFSSCLLKALWGLYIIIMYFFLW